MLVKIFPDKLSLGQAAADHAAEVIQSAITANGHARIVVASGQSQIDFFNALTRMKVDWSRVELFHLDEYIGIPMTHPGSLRKMISEHFIRKAGITKSH